MTHEVFTGKGLTLTFAAKAANGVRSVTITDDAAPLAPRIDITDSNVSVYTDIADPLGSTETPTSKVSVEMLDSIYAHVDDTLLKQVVNTVGAIAFATSGDAGDNKWAHATQEFLSYTVTIPWEDYATATAEFGANSIGAWSAV